MRVLLDTHTWVWWNTNPDKLSRKVIDLVKAASSSGDLLLSAISVWEFSKLLEKGRLKLSCDGWSFIEEAIAIPGLELVDLSAEISWHSTNLPQPFHDDPADQIIVATARQMRATLLTCDGQIQKYAHVKSVW